MRCPDCKKQVEDGTVYCPYCGAPLPQELNGIGKQKEQPLSIRDIKKETGIKVVVASVIALVCFFVWRVIIANVEASQFGEDIKTAFNETTSMMFGRIIILVVLGMIGYCMYYIAKKSRRLIFSIVTVSLCVLGFLMFFTIHITPDDEISSLSLLFSCGLMFIYGFGIPMLQGALCLSLFSSKNTIKHVIITFIAFAIGIFVGTLVGMMMIYRGSVTIALGLVYSLLGSIAAICVSILLNWREME